MEPIETPFPVEGTVAVKSGKQSSHTFGCMMEWLTEHESGDITERIDGEMLAEHGPGYEADYIVYESGKFRIHNVREIEVSA